MRGIRAPKLSSVNNPVEFVIQKEKMNSFLEHLPAEFPDYEASFGHMKTGTGEELQKNKFESLWNFIDSDSFDKFFMDMTRDVIKNYQDKNKNQQDSHRSSSFLLVPF